MALIPLQAGPLQMVFDPENAFLRHIRWGSREIVRGVFAAVRDCNWDTITGQIENLRVQRDDSRFQITFDVEAKSRDIDFSWHGTITGSSDATVVFSFDGLARRRFLKNRIGICVLHPIQDCAGQPCRVQHTDGHSTEGCFPRYISPHQPFKNIRSITHALAPGLAAEVAFEGDTFEMEDQRNWTDASYKTYCTPLELPFPVAIDEGTRIQQSVTIRLVGPHPKAQIATADETPAKVLIDWLSPRRLPPVGLGMAAIEHPLAPAARERLADLKLSHLRVDLHLSASDWPAALIDATELARAAGSQLHAALFLTDAAEQELNRFLSAVRELASPVASWIVFHKSEKSISAPWVALAHRKLALLDAAIPLAAGTNAYFAELNRGRPPHDTPAMPCYSINPQVHAFDNLSLVETLEAQPSTVQTARQFSRLPVVISPITLRPRFNPNATDATGLVPPQTDARQTTAFAAAWTVGSLARLGTCSGVFSLTYYETAGPRGVMDAEGRPYPVYHVFKALAGCSHAFETSSNRPLEVEALALLGHDGSRRILLAGFGTNSQLVQLTGIEAARIRQLEEDGFGASSPVRAADGAVSVEVPAESVVLIEIEKAPLQRGR